MPPPAERLILELRDGLGQAFGPVVKTHGFSKFKTIIPAEAGMRANL